MGRVTIVEANDAKHAAVGLGHDAPAAYPTVGLALDARRHAHDTLDPLVTHRRAVGALSDQSQAGGGFHCPDDSLRPGRLRSSLRPT